VLFAAIDDDAPSSESVDDVIGEVEPPLDWLLPQVIEALASDSGSEAQPSDVAIVVDLPGERGLLLGMALVEWGFRPIPLYNALPGPGALVNVEPIIRLLVRHARQVARAPSDGMPVFLLDAHRMSGARPSARNFFDNRSVCHATDFPSAATLRDAGIRRILLIQEEPGRPAPDLEPVLLVWQRQGLALWFKYTDDDAPAAPRRLSSRLFVVRWVYAVARLLLPRRPDGVYGWHVIGPSAG
jgi:hypothetical protein